MRGHPEFLFADVPTAMKIEGIEITERRKTVCPLFDAAWLGLGPGMLGRSRN